MIAADLTAGAVFATRSAAFRFLTTRSETGHDWHPLAGGNQPILLPPSLSGHHARVWLLGKFIEARSRTSTWGHPGGRAGTGFVTGQQRWKHTASTQMLSNPGTPGGKQNSIPSPRSRVSIMGKALAEHRQSACWAALHMSSHSSFRCSFSVETAPIETRTIQRSSKMAGVR